MIEIPTITQGTDFTLRVRAKRVGYNNYVKVSFEEISNITTKLVSLPNTKTAVSYTMDDQGRLLIPVDGTSLDCNTYGLEVTGFYNNGNWRQQLAPIFEIVNISQSENLSEQQSGEITIDLEVTLGETYVSTRVFSQTIDEMGNAISDSEADLETTMGKVDRLEQDMESLPSSIPTKTSQLTNDSTFQTAQEVNNTVQTAINNSKINNVQVDIVENGGQISATGGMSGQTLELVLRNFKGDKGDTGEKGDTGDKGEKGDQGDSVIVGQGDLPLANTTGSSAEKAITQKAVTDELDQFTQEKMEELSWVKGGITTSGEDNTTATKKKERRSNRMVFDTTNYEKVRITTPNNKSKFVLYSINGNTITNETPGSWLQSHVFTPQTGYQYVIRLVSENGTQAEIEALTAADYPTVTQYYKSRTHTIDDHETRLNTIEKKIPNVGDIPLTWKVGVIATTGYDYTTTTGRVSNEIEIGDHQSFAVKNDNNDKVQFVVYSKKGNTITNLNVSSGWVTSKGMVFKAEPGTKYIIRLAAMTGVSIGNVLESEYPTVEAIESGTVGYARNYENITGFLTWERKEISTEGISDNNNRILAKLPNIGNVEIRGNRPLGFMSVWKKVGNTITCLYGPDYYCYRYTGDYTSEYYVMLQAETGITLEYPFFSVYFYADEGRRYERFIPSAMYGKKIAFFGDSITQGYCIKQGQSAVLAMQKPYPCLVAEESGAEDYLNFALGGAIVYDTDPTTYGGLTAGWKSFERNCGKITGYDIVFIMGGTNDYGQKVSVQNFTDAYTTVLETLAENNTKVVVLTPTRRKSAPTNPPMTFDGYCEKEMQIADALGIDVIPIHTYTNSDEFKANILSDNLHLNEKAHRIIADAILDWMSKYTES